MTAHQFWLSALWHGENTHRTAHIGCTLTVLICDTPSPRPLESHPCPPPPPSYIPYSHLSPLLTLTLTPNPHPSSHLSSLPTLTPPHSPTHHPSSSHPLSLTPTLSGHPPQCQWHSKVLCSSKKARFNGPCSQHHLHRVRHQR